MAKPTLLISVFSAEEVRAAIAGGAEIIDCEDPRADIGMFEPRVITNIAYAIRQTRLLNAIPSSANIGNQIAYRRNASGEADVRVDIELSAKAAQQALGLAAAMDVGDNRPNIIKVGSAGLRPDQVKLVIAGVKRAIRDSRQFQNHVVICGFYEIDKKVWESRKLTKKVIKQMLDIGEFYFSKNGSINLNDYFDADHVKRLMEHRADHPNVELNDPPYPEDLGYPADLASRVKFYADLIEVTSADGLMLDTSTHGKLASICLLNHESNKPANPAPDELFPHGVFDIDVLETFTKYCAFKNLQSYLAGSINKIHAKALSTLNDLDVVLCRGAASEVVSIPGGGTGSPDRFSKRISEQKVRELYQALKGEGA